MLDANLKPWLIEVNSGPAMSMDGSADYVVKPALIKDTVSLLEVEPYNEYVVSISMRRTRHYPIVHMHFSSLLTLKPLLGTNEKATKENFILQFAVLLKTSEHASEG